MEHRSAELPNLRRFGIVFVTQLILRSQDIATGQGFLIFIFIEESELLVLPEFIRSRITERIGAPTLGQP